MEVTGAHPGPTEDFRQQFKLLYSDLLHVSKGLDDLDFDELCKLFSENIFLVVAVHYVAQFSGGEVVEHLDDPWLEHLENDFRPSPCNYKSSH